MFPLLRAYLFSHLSVHSADEDTVKRIKQNGGRQSRWSDGSSNNGLGKLTSFGRDPGEVETCGEGCELRSGNNDKTAQPGDVSSCHERVGGAERRREEERKAMREYG